MYKLVKKTILINFPRKAYNNLVMKVLTILTRASKCGIFSPALRRSEKSSVELIALKSARALKRLRKAGVKYAVASPSAAELLSLPALPSPALTLDYRPLLPEILAKKAALPLDELFISASPEEAAEIVEICSGCARLFTVIAKEEPPAGLFDNLYFSRGLILRRVFGPVRRVGKTAAAVLAREGAVPRSVPSIALSDLPRVIIRGGGLDFLEAEGISPSAELYALAGLVPLPRAEITADFSAGIIYLDIGGKP